MLALKERSSLGTISLRHSWSAKGVLVVVAKIADRKRNRTKKQRTEKMLDLKRLERRSKQRRRPTLSLMTSVFSS